MTRPDGASDARLTELLRADTVTAYAALLELRARHQPSVLAYARLCTAGESAARQLAAQTFTLAARETARGVDPGVPWRHRLLLLTARSAAAWAGDQRAAGLDPSVLLLLNTAGPGGPVPPMLTAFESLPARTQGLVWYGLVEAEPEARTAGHLGLTRADVVYGTEGALQSLARTCLRLRLAASDDSRCADFRRLIEESVRPDSPRASTDLDAHMVRCPHCTAAHEELCALRDTPRSALAEGLLPWGGTAYVGRSTAEPEARPRAGARTRSGTWPRPRRLVLASAALGVALAPLLLFLVSQGGDSPTGASASASASAGGALPGPPQVTVTTTVSPSPSSTSRPPSPSASPSATRSSAPPRRTSPPPFRPPGGSYAQVVNVSTARCLDVAGDFGNGTDVVTAPCSSARSQRWRVDSDRGVLQSAADPDFCLDSRGDVDKGLGIWSCDSVEGDKGDNLRFTVDPDGVIRPAIAIATGMTPEGGDGVSLEPLTGGAEQRWRAGAA
ncbi:RICIN domain-containing protein [Streptomyces canus]|uniref:RICIN domain-containing protein n=1 Tax=Streptomyces canus TaxID=58343 RepID=UPI00225515FA|nr:RICIN domain-containing protein [Streptomyces canus]MCX4859722.1 RICIN domain-containing protein [Streptomyces canus]